MPRKRNAPLHEHRLQGRLAGREDDDGILIRSNGGFRSSGGSRRTTRKETKVNVSPCPVCGGTKFIVCPECGGRRAHPCSKCNGLGIKTKGSL